MDDDRHDRKGYVKILVISVKYMIDMYEEFRIVT